MKDPLDIRRNRTGIATSPDMAKEMIENARELTPAPDPQATPLDAVRGAYILESEPFGSMPPAATVGEAATELVKSLAGKNTVVLLDALGARLQFERTGTRLYQALLAKARAFGQEKGGPSEADLTEIRDEELAHFQLVKDTIESLGADPTAVTPSANVEALASTGLLQVVSDSRIGMRSSLCAILIAELADRDSWQLLVRVAGALGQKELAERFTAALAVEEQHVTRVRAWLSALTEAKATGEAPQTGTKPGPKGGKPKGAPKAA